MGARTKQTDEVKQTLLACKGGLAAVGFFSFIINLLVLAGPMYMMLVYDRALGSGSVPTLIGLSVLLVGLFVAMGLLTIVRSRLLVRVGNFFGSRLQPRVFDAQLRASSNRKSTAALTATKDLTTVREFLSGPTPGVFFDAPWTPIFIGFAYLLHPVLGIVALIGAVVLLALGVLNDLFTRRQMNEGAQLEAQSGVLLGDAMRNAEVISALRMRLGLLGRWNALQNEAHLKQSGTNDTAGTYSALTRTFRMMLQSAVLGTGAYLAIGGELSPGAIIAASVIVARGLAPAEQAIGGWRHFLTASASYRRLKEALRDIPPLPDNFALPDPAGQLIVENLVVAAPGEKEPLVRDVTFNLRSGEVMGIIGPSGSGKSTLARALVGAWEPLRGSVRLDGAELDQWPESQLAEALGYLPQDVELFDGTVPDNVGRFRPAIDGHKVLEATRLVGAHEMILRLPRGYQTKLGRGGERLSGGERQRLGLARAVYGNPALVVLDEPNASLDGPGDAALHEAIAALKEAGTTVVIVAHRPSAIALADKIMILQEGRMVSFGEKSEVMATSANDTAAIPGGQVVRIPGRIAG